MKLNKKSLNSRIYIIAGLILLSLVIIFAAVPNNGHSASVVCIKIDGTERTLQYAIDNNLLVGSHTYSACASAPAGGHNADRIWVSVDGNENNFVNKLNSAGKVCGSSFVPYTGSLNPGQLASEIEIIISGSAKTLQQAINEGKFCLYCGDGTCNNGETCSSCSTDCGVCSSSSSSSSSGSGVRQHTFNNPTMTSSGTCARDGSNNPSYQYPLTETDPWYFTGGFETHSQTRDKFCLDKGYIQVSAYTLTYPHQQDDIWCFSGNCCIETFVHGWGAYSSITCSD